MTETSAATGSKAACREVEADLEVVRRETAAEGVVTLTLGDPGGADLPEWTPGAHIDLLLTGSLVRQYSLCGSTTNPAEWPIGVLLNRKGRGGSQFVHDRLLTMSHRTHRSGRRGSVSTGGPR